VADVVSLEEALAYLASLPTAAARQPVAADTGR
jgi:hypothetical protein